MTPETESTFRSIVNRSPAIETDGKPPRRALLDLILQMQKAKGMDPDAAMEAQEPSSDPTEEAMEMGKSSPFSAIMRRM